MKFKNVFSRDNIIVYMSGIISWTASNPMFINAGGALAVASTLYAIILFLVVWTYLKFFLGLMEKTFTTIMAQLNVSVDMKYINLIRTVFDYLPLFMIISVFVWHILETLREEAYAR